MSVVDDYLASLKGNEKNIVEHMYSVVRQMVPDAAEELSYAMPAFKYRGRGLVAIMVNKNFLSLYPFCSIKRLEVDVSAFEHTTGSIHFSQDKPLPDDLLKAIIEARKQQIDLLN